MITEAPLSVRPKGLPDVVSTGWIEGGLATVRKAKATKDYTSADLIKRLLSEFVDVQEQAEGSIVWNWKSLTPDSRYWDAAAVQPTIEAPRRTASVRAVLDAGPVVAPVGSCWQHKKGGVYMVRGYAFHTEAEDALILYARVGGPGYEASQEAGIVFARPAYMWTPDRFAPYSGPVI